MQGLDANWASGGVSIAGAPAEHDPTDIATIYANLMGEVKARVYAIQARLPMLRAADRPDSVIEAEFCLLQMRLVCELIALGSLVAHKSVGLSKKLHKAYAADEVFSALAAINPHSFPAPIRMKKGRRSAVTVQIVKGTLDRAALKSIYTQCNDALHRGDLKRVLGGAPKVFDIDILEQWIIEIGRTLSRHVIFIPDFGNALVVDMTAGPDSTVSVATVGDVRPFFG